MVFVLIFFNKVKSFLSKVKQYLIKNKVFWYFNYFLVAVCIFLLLWLHIKVFAKKHSNPNALKGGIFVGMGLRCYVFLDKFFSLKFF
ncbi:MAG: hypothetical protein DF280_02230 ['Brassica napus' phytoplasma]|nr:MAG: hypothetical protein DF280_02230 ['Brassica napus' phytoplasma]